MPGTPGSTRWIRAAFRGQLIGGLVALVALASLALTSALAAPPPDGRTYELVTPGQTGRNAMLQPLISADGNRVSYGALSGHGGAHSNVLNTYVATRNADGTWTNRVLQRPQREAAGPLGWSPVDSAGEDLSSVIAQGLAGFSAGVFPYVRFEANGNPAETLIDGRADARYITSTPDLQRSWFHLTDPVPGQPDSEFGQNLYEVDNGTATNVGLLPDGSVHQCGAALSTDFVAAHRQHYVSSDGARIFFHSPHPQAFDCTDPTPDPVRLYSRAGGTTIPISQPPAGEDEFSARFVQATPDGSTVFFQTASQMVDGDTDTGEDLYRFDLGGDYTCLSCVDGRPPANLSSFSTPVVSEDGSHAYFVSNSNLVDDPDLTPDVPHIYVNDGSGIEFVANTGQLGAAPNNFPRGQISEDGSVLFISTNEQLTEFATNNNTALYRYTADAGELECVTCVFEPYDTPVDMTANTFGGSLARAASDDGSMLFFGTTKGIAPDDTNQTLDVYRWKEGEGVALVTDGVSQTSGFSPNNAFGGTDATGANAVFTSFEALVPEHIGGIQIYTARIGGRFSPFPPPPDPGCSGDGCQGNPTPQPGVTDPGSATLSGPGNVTPSKPKAKKKKAKKCKKGFKRKRVRGKVRCVKRKQATRRSKRGAQRRKAAALRRTR
jgi:hypothetical protein